LNYNFPLYFFDPPIILNAAVTPIPGSGSAPMQVVANSGFKSAIGVDYIDTTGDFIGVYIGPAGSEKLLCIIGNGLTTRAWGVIAAQTRVSLRSMSATPITAGNLTCSSTSGNNHH
jgi:hypothetical protein